MLKLLEKCLTKMVYKLLLRVFTETIKTVGGASASIWEPRTVKQQSFGR